LKPHLKDIKWGGLEKLTHSPEPSWFW